MSKIKVFIADDHKLFRAGLIELLKDEDDIDVIGDSASADEAVEQISAWLPDVVLMDIDFGPAKEDQGIEITQRIAEHFGDQVKVIMLTMHDEPEFLVRAFEAGAKGYVLKESEPAKMIQTLREVYQGGVVLSSQQAAKVIDRFQQLKRERLQLELAELTEREKDILGLVAQGASNLQIAAELDLSEKTVRNRLSVVFSKLHVNNRTQAAQRASKLGLISKDLP